jgi:hypothetical protein
MDIHPSKALKNRGYMNNQDLNPLGVLEIQELEVRLEMYHPQRVCELVTNPDWPVRSSNQYALWCHDVSQFHY